LLAVGKRACAAGFNEVCFAVVCGNEVVVALGKVELVDG
jgi:hypothetical protein